MTRISTITCLTWMLLGASISGWGQATLQGRVTDQDGNALPSSTVTAENGKGSFADMNGSYTLELPPGEHEISYSFMGFLTTTKSFPYSRCARYSECAIEGRCRSAQ